MRRLQWSIALIAVLASVLFAVQWWPEASRSDFASKVTHKQEPIAAKERKNDPTMISEADALPGRDTPMELSNEHFILKTPLRGTFPDGLKRAVFATGCYWGTEKGYWKLPSIFSTAVGFAGGFTPNPTYREVCTGRTGHTECVLVVYDPAKISYADLLKQFFESHDPSQLNRQGMDAGTQYRGAIFYTDEEQKALAEAAKASYQNSLGKEVVTQIEPLQEFYYADEGHQQYLARPGSRPYCSAEPQGVPLAPFEEWAPEELRASHAPKLPSKFWKKHGPKPGCTIKGPNEQIAWPK